MIQSCFSSQVPGDLARIHGIMNCLKYEKILNENSAVSAKKLKLGHGQIFQQDNDPNIHLIQ